MSENVITIPAHGTPGFEVGRVTKCFNPDGSPVPDSRKDGAPLEWYDGKFWFATKADAEEYLADYADVLPKRENILDGFCPYVWLIKEDVPLFG